MRIVLLVVAALALVGCASGNEPERFSEHGFSLRVPDGWSVSGLSNTNSPRRLIAATYGVSRSDVEGDCGGVAAVERLPRDGAYVVLIDYGRSLDAGTRRRDFARRLPLTFEDGQLANFECFGRSYAFRLLMAGRAFQAHVGLGRDADRITREAALSVLNSLRDERT
jgi:hypothetical protein